MKLSTRARYALRMMLDVSRHGEGQPVSLRSVANRQQISRGYLEQLARDLRRARLVRAVAGRRGGYRLARPAQEITIGEIVEASIGPIDIVDCVSDPEVCIRSVGCECRFLYRLINKQISGILKRYSLADLADPSWLSEMDDVIVGLDQVDSDPDSCAVASAPKKDGVEPDPVDSDPDSCAVAPATKKDS